MTNGPMERYRALIAADAIIADPAQRMAVEKLQILHNRLRGYDAARPKPAARGFFGFGAKAAKAEPALSGLYIYGGVGRGKSMLMDLFFDGAPVIPKRRVHFHAFMQEVHAGVRKARATDVADPIPPVVEAIAKSATLLCFDEVQVADIADAMILGRVFEGLFARGVVVVATSNRSPDDLYKDGLNRDLFLPFIAMFNARLDIHHLEGPGDFRMELLRRGEAYFTPLGAESDRALDILWAERVGGERAAPATLLVHGRKVAIPQATENCARASFADLCAAPLGAADYLALVEAFGVLFLDRIPILSRANNNEAKRFVILVDALYEAKARLICSAAAEPADLYPEGEGAFEFARTASRLAEMRSAEWISAQG